MVVKMTSASLLVSSYANLPVCDIIRQTFVGISHSGHNVGHMGYLFTFAHKCTPSQEPASVNLRMVAEKDQRVSLRQRDETIISNTAQRSRQIYTTRESTTVKCVYR